MSQPDRSKLPIRMPPFGGVTKRTLDGSQPDWEAIGHVEAPDGAPNVLVVLIDDAGFGNPATFGGPIDTPNYTRMADEGVRYNRFHVPALCSPTRAALLTGRNSHAVGLRLRRRVLDRVPRLHGVRPRRLRSVPENPPGQRLQHRRVRQVAPDARRAAGPGRPVHPLARGLGVRLLLRLPRRRIGPVGPVSG